MFERSGEEVTPGQNPFTPRAKKVLELTLREALSLGHNHIGTGHILLGLVRDDEGVAARVLLDFGADAETVRNHVIRMFADANAPDEVGAGGLPTRTAPAAPQASAWNISEMKGLPDDELDKALDRVIDQLILEEQDFSSRRRILYASIASLRAERDRRRHGDD